MRGEKRLRSNTKTGDELSDKVLKEGNKAASQVVKDRGVSSRNRSLVVQSSDPLSMKRHPSGLKGSSSTYTTLKNLKIHPAVLSGQRG